MLQQLLANGIIMVSIYAIVALGFALIYNTTRIFHIAYAVLYMFAPYILLTFYNTLGFPLIISLLLSIILTILLSIMIELVIYNPLIINISSENVILISSLGVMIVVINLVAMISGNETKMLNSDISGSISILDIIITHNQLWQISVSVILLIAFLVFLKLSLFGLKRCALRADRELFMVLLKDPKLLYCMSHKRD